MPFMRVDKDRGVLYKLLYVKITCQKSICLCAYFCAGCFSCNTRGTIGFFLYLLNGKLCKCRSPPFINLF